MKSINRWLILATLLIAALISYIYGSSTGVVAFIFLGAVFEGAFWLGLIREEIKNSDK